MAGAPRNARSCAARTIRFAALIFAARKERRGVYLDRGFAWLARRGTFWLWYKRAGIAVIMLAIASFAVELARLPFATAGYPALIGHDLRGVPVPVQRALIALSTPLVSSELRSFENESVLHAAVRTELDRIQHLTPSEIAGYLAELRRGSRAWEAPPQAAPVAMSASLDREIVRIRSSRWGEQDEIPTKVSCIEFAPRGLKVAAVLRALGTSKSGVLTRAQTKILRENQAPDSCDDLLTGDRVTVER